MSEALHIDCFTSLDDLKPRERKDPDAVLAVLRRVGRFSIWDMDNATLRKTVAALIDDGRIVTDNQRFGFPWIAVSVPDMPIPKQKPVDPPSFALTGTQVRRASFARRHVCTVKHMQRNVDLASAAIWMSRECCDGVVLYATIVNGRVSPRCEVHARADAVRLGVTIDERLVIEHPSRKRPPLSIPRS